MRVRRESGEDQMNRRPPYRITTDILSRVAEIAEAVGRAEAAGLSEDLRLRRINRIRSIQGSLAIEGNILTEEQISTILDGKPVVAPPRDVQEARNAIVAYDRYEQWNPASEADLLNAHQILMTGLVDAPGHYRRGGVAVRGQDGIQHVGPARRARAVTDGRAARVAPSTPTSTRRSPAPSSTTSSSSSIRSRTATVAWAGSGRR